MNRTFGIELELGDVPTVALARDVYTMQGLDPNDWVDRGRNSKIREYDYWNVQSDPTLGNSDGTVCMYSAIDENGKKVSITKGNKRLQRGAEIVSPVCIDVKQSMQTLQHIVYLAEEYGATAKPELKHALHVHVGIEDFDLEDVKNLMLWQHREGKEFFQQFPGYDGKFTKRGYWDWLIKEIKTAETAEVLWHLYRVRTSTGTVSNSEFAYRKDVNPAHWLENKVEGLDRPLTVEYRAFGSTTDIKQIENVVRSCIQITNAIKENK